MCRSNVQMILRSGIFVVMIFIVLSSGWSDDLGRSKDRPVEALRHSDVVFMYDNPERYQDYGCTMLGWAGSAQADRIALAHKRGVRHFTSSVGFLTEASRVIDFCGVEEKKFLDAACRNFKGEPFIVPWLWDHKYKGEGSYWWCTNSPLYRQYLEQRLKQVIDAGADGLHIDDYRGASGGVTWLSSCFCKYCLKGFREYVRENVEKAELEKLGIKDINTFDYRKFLMERGVTPETYNEKRSNLPLADAFYDFHVKSATAFVAQYHKRAEELRGRPMSLCVNSGLSNPQALTIGPYLSYFSCEVHQDAATLKPPRHPIYTYKLADGIGTPVASTASGQDWAYIYEHGNTALVRTWIALSYAMGQNFMAPQRQWCYTQEKGTHWYDGPTEEYAWVYQFVRKQAALLDGYEAVAPVAVIYDNQLRRKGRGDITNICIELAERNIPFKVLIAGDDWLSKRLSYDEIEGYDAVILPEDSLMMDEAQASIVQGAIDNGFALTWTDKDRDAKLRKLIGNPIVVEGDAQVMVVPRVSDNPEKPFILHLLNRAYNGEKDEMIEQKEVTIRLHRSLWGEHGTAKKATMHQPGLPSKTIGLSDSKESVTLTIPSLTLWGIVEL